MMLMTKSNFLSCALGLKILLKVNDFLLLKLPRGTLVRVRYPRYVSGYTGVIQSHERGANRWIIQVQNNIIEDSSNPFIVSLEILDFEIIELPPVVIKPNPTPDNE